MRPLSTEALQPLDQIRKTEKGSKHLDDAMMFFVFNVHREKR
jgi:hypothetical protein